MNDCFEMYQGTLSPEPPGIFRMTACRKDGIRKDDDSSPSFRISTRLGARVASPQSPILQSSEISVKNYCSQVKHRVILKINRGSYLIAYF